MLDVAVVGLGAMGSAALWRLAARGARVAGFDRFDPPHDRGSSHGESRIFRTAYYEGAWYVPLLREAGEWWHRLERESGEPLLTMTGALMIGDPDGELVAGTLASVRAHGLAHEVLDATETMRRYPQHRMRPGEVAVREDGAGVLRPERAVAAMLDRALRLGAAVHRDTRVTRVAVSEDGARVETAAGTHQAGHVVVAAGPWLASTLPSLGVPLRVERQVTAWFPVDDAEAFSPGRFPVFCREVDGALMRYGIPALDGRTVKVAVHHEGATVDPDGLDRRVGEADLAPLRRYIVEMLAGVQPHPKRTAVCMYTDTPDLHFLIGSPEGSPRLTVLGGFSGHGFKFAPLVGDIAADLATQGHTARDIGAFRLSR